MLEEIGSHITSSYGLAFVIVLVLTLAIWVIHSLAKGLIKVIHIGYTLRKITQKSTFQNRYLKITGKLLQLSVAICVGILIGGFAAECHGAGSWPQLITVFCVGIVIGRVTQLNTDIIKKIPPLPNRFPNTHR